MARMTLEAVAFQNTDFFENLTQAITELREDSKLATLEPAKFFDTDPIRKLATIINKHTNLSVSFKDGDATGFATEILLVDANHIFLDQDMVRLVMSMDATADPYETITKIMTAKKKNTTRGGVDLMGGKVYGSYETIPVVIHLPRNLMLDNKFLSASECAAIVLHEVGHSFTALEMVGRTVSTNQVLGGLSKCLDKTISNEDRVAVYAKAAKDLKMTDDQGQALKSCKSEAQLATVLLDAEIVKSKSELGASIYDVNSCEMMADQYANRMGAGKELVTGLEKYLSLYGQDKRGVFWSQVLGVLFSILMTIATSGFWAIVTILLVVFGPDKSAQIYDKPLDRIKRIKRDNVERLKDPTLSKSEKLQTLAIIRGIEEVENRGTLGDELLWAEKIAYYLRPGYRAAHKYEMLQKDLEGLANNDLFAKSAELKVV